MLKCPMGPGVFGRSQYPGEESKMETEVFKIVKYGARFGDEWGCTVDNTDANMR